MTRLPFLCMRFATITTGGGSGSGSGRSSRGGTSFRLTNGLQYIVYSTALQQLQPDKIRHRVVAARCSPRYRNPIEGAKNKNHVEKDRKVDSPCLQCNCNAIHTT
eukprot:scaffold5297_cov108-Skeletonema_marinoi.AAC.1